MPKKYSPKHFALLFLLSAQTLALSVLWHNGVYALGIVCFGPEFWDSGDEAVFFIIALFVVPTGFVLGAIGRLWTWAVVQPIDKMKTRGIHLPNARPYFAPLGNYAWLWQFSKGIEAITERKIRTTGAFALVFFLGIIGLVITQRIIQRQLSRASI